MLISMCLGGNMTPVRVSRQNVWRILLLIGAVLYFSACASKSDDDVDAQHLAEAKAYVAGNFVRTTDPGRLHNPALKDKSGVIWSAMIYGPGTHEQITDATRGCAQL